MYLNLHADPWQALLAQRQHADSLLLRNSACLMRPLSPRTSSAPNSVQIAAPRRRCRRGRKVSANWHTFLAPGAQDAPTRTSEGRPAAATWSTGIIVLSACKVSVPKRIVGKLRACVQQGKNSALDCIQELNANGSGENLPEATTFREHDYNSRLEQTRRPE